MLRNRGVIANERRIRHDMQWAYEYDPYGRPRRTSPPESFYRQISPHQIAAVKTIRNIHSRSKNSGHPSFNSLNSSTLTPNRFPQPIYCTARTRPIYFHTSRSSVSSYGVKRVYLPDEDYRSAEAPMYYRNPRYSIGCYPGDAYHTMGRSRPCRRGLKYEDYYSRRPSPEYIDDDNYYPRCSRDKKLVRKVTRKLSPIFPCDCATASNVRELKKNNNNDINNRAHRNDLSKVAKELSRDVFKIITLLQKADGEDEEQFSSTSLLQNIQDLDSHSSNNYANLITQRVNIYPKMGKQKQVDPLTRFKSACGVKSKLEALVDALKQYEVEKYLHRGSSNSDNEHKSSSDSPSVETRPYFSGKKLKSSTTLFGGKRKDIVLQTEQPKTSNKSVCGKVKVKKGVCNAERKSLRSRLSWRRKEGSGIKMRRESANERLSDNKTERKRSFFKTKSRSNIRSINESEQFESDRNNTAKQGQKAGLMIQIGGISARKKSAARKEKVKEKVKEKFKEKKPKLPKPPKPWIKKFVEENDPRNSIRVRWNNKAFYSKSSSTIVELVHYVNKHMGINKNSKSHGSLKESTSKNKKLPKTASPKRSKTRTQKSPKKIKCKQKLEAYMVPQIIVPGPFYRPNRTNEYINNTSTSTSHLNELTPQFYNGLNTNNILTTNYFEILLPENLLVSMSEDATSDIAYKIVEYVASSKKTVKDNVQGMIVDQENLKETGSFDDIARMQAKVVQLSNNSLCSRKRREDSETNVIRKGPESKPKKSRIKEQKLNVEETESQFFETSVCSLVERIIQAECLHWMPRSSDSFVSASCEELDDIMKKPELSPIQISSIHGDIDDIIVKTDTNIAAETVNDDLTQNDATYKNSLKESKEVYIRRKFSAFHNNVVQWKKRVSGTFSDSIIGILSRKSFGISVLWSLVKILRKIHSPVSKRVPPPHDLSLVQPPGTVSLPDCSLKSLNLYLPRRSLQPQKQRIAFEPLRLAQLASAALQAKKELALIESSLIPIQCNAVEIEKFETKKESDALLLDEPTGPINVIDTVQATVPDATKVEPDISPIPPSKHSCRIRLVRSVTNLQTQKNIQPKAIRSSVLLQNRTYQYRTKSILLLFAHPVIYGHAGVEETFHAEERQLQNLTECYSGSTEYELQVIQLETESNKAPEATVNGQDIIRSENGSRIINDKLPSDNTAPEEVLKENLNQSNYCEKRKSQKTCYNKKKKNTHLTYVTQFGKTENNTFPFDISSIPDNNPAGRFSVEVTKGDKITKIIITNPKSNKKSNTKSTHLRISQDPAFTYNVEPMKQSTKRTSRKNVKVCINISSITDKEPENGENQLNKPESNHVLTNQLFEEADKRQEVVTEYTDLIHNTDDAVGIQRCAVYKSRSLQPFKCLQNAMNRTNIQHNITKSTGEIRMHSTEFKDFNTSPTDSYLYDIAAEEYVNEILGDADKIDRTKLKRIVELRALKNKMLLNLTSFAEMALKRELASDHTNTYMSLRQQLKRRKKIVSILSEINMRNIADGLGEKAKIDNSHYFSDLESNVSWSLWNIFEREPISHHVKANVQTNFHVRANMNIVANEYLPHLVSPFSQQHLELKEFLSSSKDERISSSDTFIDIDDARLGAFIKSYMLYLKRNAKEKIDVKPNCWCCVRNINRKSKKKHKEWKTIYTNRYLRSCQNDDIILQRADSSKSQSPFTEYKVLFKNNPMRADDPIERMYFEGKKSDILQSCRVKKAVLQLYSDKTVDNSYIVAKVPKYLRLS